ncbi:MAG: acetyl-CoA acyltransferase [Bradymonadia bacterium]|jgi:acetyl-CoA acyltransferase
MNALQPAYLVDARRTPIGRYGRSFASVRPDDLAATVLADLRARHPEAVDQLDQVILGATNQAGEDNRNVARMASLLAGLPYQVPGVTVNRLCGSGLEAVTDAVMRIWTGDAELAIAGGVESMSRAPFTYGKAPNAYDRVAPTVYDTTIGWRYPNPKMAERFPLDSMGLTAENVAEKWEITREQQDAFALESQVRASAAMDAGAFAAEIVPVDVPGRKGAIIRVEHDESPRPDSTMEGLAKLSPVFKKGGTVTAGNSSPINDGAAALLIASEAAVERYGLTPMARVVSFATAGVHPSLMGEGPIPASQRALTRAGWTVDDLELVELNEAFGAQSLACIRGLNLDPSMVNIRGGALALGHPIGASGARILVTLAHAMQQTGAARGLAALCIGVGQGIAMTVERV